MFNLHASRYIPFQELLKRNIIDTNENILVNVMALCYEIDVVVTVQKAQRFIVNFNSASTVLMEMLNGGPNLPISDIHGLPLLVVVTS